MEIHLSIHHEYMNILISLLLPIFFSCNAKENQFVDNTITEIKSTQKISYSKIIQQADSIKTSCKSKTISEVGINFSKFIGEEITPYWIGTPWDFNGVTQKPNEGFIACGYLVTTILRDAGVNINRVKMAQCASEQMINSLTTKKENYSKLSFEDFIAKVKGKGIGISIIGLDNHTGFLYNDGKEMYFIHSSYVGEGKLAKEIANENQILMHSKYKVVGFISKDEGFLRKWMSIH